MSTIQEIISSEFITGVSLPKINANFQALNTDKLEASDIAWKQDTLVSGTNIKTINAISLLWSGDITIPTLTDWDKWDITVSYSSTLWEIDPNAVTNGKLATMPTASIKWRISSGTGNVEDLSSAQATSILDIATTGAKWLMSAIDKTKLDWVVTGWSYSNYSPVSNTWASQENLYSFTLPWNTLWASWVIEWEVFFSSISTSNTARSVNIELYFWANVVILQINYDSANTYNQSGSVKFRIFWLWSTSSQKIEIIWLTIPQTAIPVRISNYWTSTISLDSTVWQTITIKTNPSWSWVTRTAESIIFHKIS